MKWLIGVIAAVSIFNSARAEDITIRGDSGGCAVFQGSFTRDGWRGVHNARPVYKCNLVENVGVKCTIHGHGIDTIPDPLRLSGDELKIEASGYNVLQMRILCKQGSGCYQAQLWNVDTKWGFGCDTSKHIAYVPPKPAPLPPPLLRKPDASNEPVKPQPVELEKKDWTL